MTIDWKIKHFNELSVQELYTIFRLRIAVFVVEQNCPYQDADEKDYLSFHLMGYDENKELVAYSRILPAGISFNETSIGRVLTSHKVRRMGAGKKLIKKATEYICQQYGAVQIRIGAQCYLINFYSDFGFKIDSAEYLEDGIPHVEMLLNSHSEIK